MTVVVSHIKLGGANVTRYAIGPYAVTCFFVLSGFLITNLLLQERRRTGTISLKKFYARRALRIFPAFWVLCMLFLVASVVMKRPIDWPAYTACVLYVSNYYMAFHGFGTTMNHTWSLAIEEQFYLFWPAIFRRFSVDRKNLMRILVGTIVAVWVYRAILEYWIRVKWFYVYCAFGTRADALAVGCLVAVLAYHDRLPHWLTEFKALAAVAAATIIIVAVSRAGGGLQYYLLPPAFAVLILHAVRYHRSLAYRWLNWAPLRLLGAWSYSIYLYHVFLHRVIPPWFGIARVPMEMAAAIVMGAASYYLVEKPVLSIRDRVLGKERAIRPARRVAHTTPVSF